MMFHRLVGVLLASTFLTLPGCDRIEGIKQHVQGSNALQNNQHGNGGAHNNQAMQGNSSGAPGMAPMGMPMSDDMMKQMREMCEKKMDEKISAEVKKQVEERLHDIEKKLVIPSKSDDGASASSSSNASSATDFRKGFSDVAAKAVPAVVNVSTTQVIDQKSPEGGPRMGPGLPFEDLFKEFFEQAEKPKRVQSVGSGFFVKVTDKEAFVVTNNHVISDAKKITVILADKTEVDAVLHATDERTDLAVLRIKLDNLPADKRKITTLEWGNSDESKVGQFVVAIGNPFGLGSTVTSGIISGKGRDIVLRAKSKATDLVDDFIQHDASINMGNSGGVLLNMDGKVIGINTAIFSPSGGSIGIGFAIPESLAKATVDQLIEHGRTRRGWLGVAVVPVSTEIAESLGLGEIRGGIVKSLTKDGPAEKAGFKERDIIIEFDGKKLGDNQRLTRVVGETPVGKTVPVKILRDEKEITLEVTVGEYPANLTMEEAKKQTMQTPPEKVTEILGMSLAELPKAMDDNSLLKGFPGLKDAPKGGVLIVDVKENSSAEDCGLKKGDIISEVNMQPISTPKEVEATINDIHKKDPKRPSVLLTVIRNGSIPQYVAIQFKSIVESAEENEKESKNKLNDSKKDSKEDDHSDKEKDKSNKENEEKNEKHDDEKIKGSSSENPGDSKKDNNSMKKESKSSDKRENDR